uniref:Putative ovule protein n=1 Tax=Solanum chacoense TaxID=4108 RepID=A0A0V0GU57_SOLCH
MYPEHLHKVLADISNLYFLRLSIVYVNLFNNQAKNQLPLLVNDSINSFLSCEFLPMMNIFSFMNSW